jgi:hypothetical protein
MSIGYYEISVDRQRFKNVQLLIEHQIVTIKQKFVYTTGMKCVKAVVWKGTSRKSI